jgi:hypothetical protein
MEFTTLLMHSLRNVTVRDVSYKVKHKLFSDFNDGSWRSSISEQPGIKNI